MALIICSECGKEYSDKAFACPNCGNPTHTTATPIPTQNQPQYATATQYQMNIPAVSPYAEKLAIKEQTSGIIWTVIAAIQVIIGISGLWITLYIAVLNGFTAWGCFQKAKKVRNPYIGMVNEYEKQLTSLIIALVYNAVLGGIIGVAGNIFDLITRNYVLTNRAVFESIAEETAKKVEEEAYANGKMRLTIEYTRDSCASGAVAYTIDGQPEKYIVNKFTPVNHYLTPGMHTIALNYNLKKYSFQVEVNENKTLPLHVSVWVIKLNSSN